MAKKQGTQGMLSGKDLLLPLSEATAPYNKAWAKVIRSTNPSNEAAAQSAGLKASMDAASLHTAKKIVELLKSNIVGSVYIPHSGEHGYDTSHDKLREGTLETLETLIKEMEEFNG